MESIESTGLTETFDLLTHPHRRYLLYYLTDQPDVVNIETLATTIAKWDGDHTGTEQTEYREILYSLYHTHLPKLADAGVISFGPNRDSVELKEMDRLGRFLDDTAVIEGYSK